MDTFKWKPMLAMLIVASFAACNTDRKPLPPQSSSSQQKTSKESDHIEAVQTPLESKSQPKTRRKYTAVEIVTNEATGESKAISSVESLEAIRSALKPFQVLLGRWNGLSRKSLADHPEWAYDWVSHPKQPSLRMTSEKGTYVREGRLSYIPELDQFEFAATDADGAKRTFRGTFIEPIRDVAGDQKKLQRTYKLQLTEPDSHADGEQWRITFNQQENNRYIVEIDRKRGNSHFIRIDTIHTQREGTSFAVSDTDFGEKTCIISQGLGTISVSYRGQSYWVCCTGCKAAFDDDPEKWIAKWEEKKKSMEK